LNYASNSGNQVVSTIGNVGKQIIGGSGFKKGSPEAKEFMAKLRTPLALHQGHVDILRE
jgi:hypothetical protein